VASFLLDELETKYHIRLIKVLISFREWLHSYLGIRTTVSLKYFQKFSSLSESGFIPTNAEWIIRGSFRLTSSHLFQRVASFLPVSLGRLGLFFSEEVLISFREWLHSYTLDMFLR